MFECEICGAEDADMILDPMILETKQLEVERNLCAECYRNLLENK